MHALSPHMHDSSQTLLHTQIHHNLHGRNLRARSARVARIPFSSKTLTALRLDFFFFLLLFHFSTPLEETPLFSSLCSLFLQPPPVQPRLLASPDGKNFPLYVASPAACSTDHDACPRCFLPNTLIHPSLWRLAKMQTVGFAVRGRHASLGLAFALISGSASNAVPSASLILLHVSERGSGGSMTVPWIRYGAWHNDIRYGLHFAPQGHGSTHAQCSCHERSRQSVQTAGMQM